MRLYNLDAIVNLLTKGVIFVLKNEAALHCTACGGYVVGGRSVGPPF